MINILDLEFQGHQKVVAAFLVETEAGPILFETGPHSCFPILRKRLKELGYGLADVQHVFLTHIHLDHAGAAWAFAEKGAKIYVHPFGARHLAAPERLMESARRIYLDQMDVLWGDMKAIPASQLVEVAHGATFSVGSIQVRSWHTPGHAVHHIAWQIDGHIMTGDVAGARISNGPVVPPCPPPDINIEDWEQSIRLILELNPTDLYLTHFGKVTEVEQHFSQLNSILWDWANWMKPHWENGREEAVVTPIFQEYTRQQLIDKGVREEDLKRYENANPSWTSVAGLMRYWRKRNG